MEKDLLKSEEQLDSFISAHTGILGFYGRTVNWLDKPERYPCILIWQITDDPNGPAYLEGEYVYPEDFNEE